MYMYTILKRKRVMLRLIIDNREGKLKELFGESATYENLTFGDIEIRREGEPVFLFERKTVADLMASIKDGRYKRQKQQVLEMYGPSIIYYIIEGPVPSSASGTTADKIITSSLINTLLRDKIGIFYTRDVCDTRDLVVAIWERINNTPEKYIRGETEHTGVTTKANIAALKEISPWACYINQLCQIPLISLKGAEAIAGRYPSMSSLITALNDVDAEEKLKLLMNITTQGSNRRISSKALANVITYLQPQP